MKTTVKASLILVAAVALLNIIVFALELHKNFTISQIAFGKTTLMSPHDTTSTSTPPRAPMPRAVRTCCP